MQKSQMFRKVNRHYFRQLFRQIKKMRLTILKKNWKCLRVLKVTLEAQMGRVDSAKDTSGSNLGQALKCQIS